jgi:hypothetical protein
MKEDSSPEGSAKSFTPDTADMSLNLENRQWLKKGVVSNNEKTRAPLARR